MWPRSKDRGNLVYGNLIFTRQLASMWPRSKDRGNSLPWPWRFGGGACFNVASVQRPRKFRRSIRRPSRISSFNVASVQRPRKYSPRLRGAWSPRTSFNVASVQRPRKSGVSRGSEGPALASMWPRSKDRGNKLTKLTVPRPDESFNVASVQRPRKSLATRQGHLDNYMLQCGLGPKTEEISGLRSFRGLEEWLQCGLGPKTEEMKR